MKIIIFENNYINQLVLSLILTELNYTDITIIDYDNYGIKQLQEIIYDIIFFDNNDSKLLTQIKNKSLNSKAHLIGICNEENRYLSTQGIDEYYNQTKDYHYKISNPYKIKDIKQILNRINI